jgi:hypothetical protein
VASVVAARVLKSIRLGLVAGVFFSFSEGLPFLVEPIRFIYFRWFTPSSMAAEYLFEDALKVTAPPTISQYPRYLVDPHFLLAVAALLSVIVLVSHLQSTDRETGASRTSWYHWALLGALFGGVALMESLVFALGVIGWAALVVWQASKERAISSLLSFVFAIVPAAVLAIFQGGILTSTLYSSASEGTGLGTAFRIALTPLPFAFGNPSLQFAASPPWIAFYAISFGLPLLAAPILLVWALRSKHSIPLVWLSAIGIVGMLFPHIAIYHFNTFLRWLSFGHTTLAFLLGIGVLGLVSNLRHRWMPWSIAVACAALTFGWPLAISIGNLAKEGTVRLGQSTEDHWTISALHRQGDNIDWYSGRPYEFLLGAEAREFLRSLPSTSRVLTNRFPEVPLLIRGVAPHKNTDVFSYTNFRYPSPTYFDALYALDPLAMKAYGITHIVLNYKWFLSTSPETHAALENPRHFSLLFSDEDSHEGFAWHHVYRVLPEFYEESPKNTQDLLRNLPDAIPRDATVYVSPAIPADTRWALLYALRERTMSSATAHDNHINVRLSVAEPQPNDQYDYALLIDEPTGDRWLNWPFTPQDIPSAWGLHPSQRIWHTLGIGLYALERRECPSRSIAGVPSAWHVPANSPSTLSLDCLLANGQDGEASSSILFTVLSHVSSHIEIDVNGSTSSFNLEPGANFLPLKLQEARQLTIASASPVWVRAHRTPATSEESRRGIPALQAIPTFDGMKLLVDVRIFGNREGPMENQVVWDLVKQRRIYGHWWHWDSPHRIGAWRLMQDHPPNHGSHYSFTLDFSTLQTSLAVNGQPARAPREVDLPENPGEPYVLYFTLFQPGARVQSIPVAWITYGPDQEPSVLLAPRFILLDQVFAQD